MNIFYLHEDAKTAAEMHLDKHCVKMIVEYAQLMSTAHRVLDGEFYYGKTARGHKIQRWKHPNKNIENTLYKASHINHPSAIWARESVANYIWLFSLFENLCDEYTHRYGKIHSTDSLLRDLLCKWPVNISYSQGMTKMPQAMPDDVKQEDSITAYRNYYIKYKKDFAKWTKRKKPKWFNTKDIMITC